MKNFGLGLVGASLQGGYLLAPAVVDSVDKTELRLRAIYDGQHENAKEIVLNTEFGYSQRNISQDIYLTTDLWHMFNDVLLDAMLIAAPSEEHRALVESVLSGFDKIALLSPLAGNMGDAHAIVDASREKTVLFNLPRRYEAGWQKAHELLRSGVIGKLQFINLQAFLPETNYLRLWERTQTGKDDLFLGQLSNYMDVFNWFADAPCVQISGIGDEGEHDLDDYDPNGPFKETFSQLPLRWRTKVSAHEPGMVVDDFPADHYLDRAAIQLMFGNNVIGNLNITSSGPEAHDAEDLELVGEKGRIWFNAAEGTLYIHFWDGSASERISGLGKTEFPLWKRYTHAFLEQFIGFIAGASPATSAVEGAEALELTLAALESIQNNGVPVLIGIEIEGECLPEISEESEPEPPVILDDFIPESEGFHSDPEVKEDSLVDDETAAPKPEAVLEDIVEEVVEDESVPETSSAPELEFAFDAMFMTVDHAETGVEIVEKMAEDEAPGEPDFDIDSLFTIEKEDTQEPLTGAPVEDTVESESEQEEETVLEPDFQQAPEFTLEERVEALVEEVAAEVIVEEDTLPEPVFQKAAEPTLEQRIEAFVAVVTADEILEEQPVVEAPADAIVLEPLPALVERVAAFVDAVAGSDECEEEETSAPPEMAAAVSPHEAVTQEYAVIDEDTLLAEVQADSLPGDVEVMDSDGPIPVISDQEESLPEPITVEAEEKVEDLTEENVQEPDIFSEMFVQEEETEEQIEEQTAPVESEFIEAAVETSPESEQEPDLVLESVFVEDTEDSEAEEEPLYTPTDCEDFVIVDDDTDETLETTVIEEGDDEVNSVHPMAEESEDDIVESPSVVIAEKIHLDDYVWDIVPLDPVRNTVDLITLDDWDNDDPVVEIIEAVEESSPVFSEAETQRIDLSSDMVDWPEELPPGQENESFDSPHSSND